MYRDNPCGCGCGALTVPWCSFKGLGCLEKWIKDNPGKDYKVFHEEGKAKRKKQGRF